MLSARRKNISKSSLKAFLKAHRRNRLKARKFVEQFLELLDLILGAVARQLLQALLVVDRQHAALLLRPVQDDCDVLRDIFTERQIVELRQPIRVQMGFADECAEAIACDLLAADDLLFGLEHHDAVILNKNFSPNEFQR